MAADVDWLEFAVTTNSEIAEAVAQLFNAHGYGGAVVEIPVDCLEHELAAAESPATVIVKAYLPLDGTAGEARRRLEEGLWHLSQISPIPEPVVRELPEEQWADAWKQHYHLLRVGRRTVIVPAWEEYDEKPGEVVIRLEPGMAFGTGLHPSTRLCLEALECHLAPGRAVLDVGTGSGVLAIAAAKLGAPSVLALDTDPVAIVVARENVERNAVEGQVTLQRGSLPSRLPDRWGSTPSPMDGPLYLLEDGCFDLVVINILAPVIVGMAPALAARLGSEGRLITAGLIEGQEGDVTAALQMEGLRIVQRAQEQDWVCLVAQRG
jgi:ribosomal protein L11 methyltransferase